MTDRSTVGAPSPLGLRLVHAAAFLAMAGGVLYVSVPEWRHVVGVLGHAFHVGPLPRWTLLGGSVVAVLAVLRLVWALVRGHSAPLWASGAVLVAVVGAVAAGDGRPLREARAEETANLSILRVGRRVHLTMVQELQAHGEVPTERGDWSAALEVAGPVNDRVRTRELSAVPMRLEWLESDDDRPATLVPGALWVHVTPDGVGFSVRMVGLREGEPAMLLDERGRELILRGLYNPDLPPMQQPSASPLESPHPSHTAGH